MIYYTDGSCVPNPGEGGWAVIEFPEVAHYGYARHTTNNAMELTAMIKALEMCSNGDTIYCDSQYVVNGITNWMYSWERKKWSGVKNPELWKQAYRLKQGKNVTIRWVKGHDNNAGNELADMFANYGKDCKSCGSVKCS